MIQYREVQADEINRGLFKDFIRRQVVTKCWRKENGIWVIREDPFTDDWSESDYRILISCLRNTVQTGGFVYAAFYMDMLKGGIVDPTKVTRSALQNASSVAAMVLTTESLVADKPDPAKDAAAAAAMAGAGGGMY